MSGTALAGVSFVVMLALIFVRVPIGLAMLICGIGGTTLLTGSLAPVMASLKSLTYDTFSNYSLTIVPLFLLMGSSPALAACRRRFSAPPTPFSAIAAAALPWRPSAPAPALVRSAAPRWRPPRRWPRWRSPKCAATAIPARSRPDAGRRRHARHPYPAFVRARHLCHPRRAEHRQALRRRACAGDPGGDRLHDRHRRHGAH